MGEPSQPSRWSLDDLFPEPVGEKIEAALAELEQAVCEFEALRPVLTDSVSSSDFLSALAKLEVIVARKTRIESYAHLRYVGNMSDSEALRVRDRIEQVLADVSNRCLFFDLWFRGLPDNVAASLIGQSGDLRYFLETLRRFKPFSLSEAEEKIITAKDVNGIEALVHVYDLITNQWSFTLEVDGKNKTLTRDELISYVDSPSADLRERAYRELLRVYEENVTVLSQIYIHRVRDWYSEGIEMRGYSSPIAARNIANDLSGEVVETLLSVCRRNVDLFQRYFRLKSRFLGLDKLRRYDLYAPLASSLKTFEYAEAARMVLDTYEAFSPQVASLARRVFDEGHLDSEIRKDKQGGAFCHTALPELTPWVLINYDRHPRDVATLAHELGHAIHSMLASHHSVLTQQSCLPLAETASVFGEMLFTDRLLTEERDPFVRRELLARALDDAYLTVMSQAYFTLFEIDAHDMISKGCTMDELADHYLELRREHFGDAVQVGDEFRWEWVGISHIYEVPFYTYAYSFGQLLVLALYQQYKREGQAFLPRYLRILAYGGSEAPLKILTEAGIDIASPEFWQGGFDILNAMLVELEELS